MLTLFAALSTGACIGAFTLYFARFGVAGSATPATRLSRLRNAEVAISSAPIVGSLFNLRKRASLNFGGVNLVSANVLQRWGAQLERSGLSLNVREYFMIRIGVAAALVAIGMLLTGQFLIALLFAPVGYWIVGVWVKRKIGARQRKMESQLAEFLQMLGSGLRAGFGLLQAMESATEQLQAPLAIELRRTMRDTAMGSSVEKSLTALNGRVGSSDFDIVITAIMIQRSVGGNLAEILDNVAQTMRERERIRNEIRTLTSQQRMSGYVIGGIPIALEGVFLVVSPDFVKLLFTDSLGRMMIGAALTLEFLGFMVIRKIVNIEV